MAGLMGLNWPQQKELLKLRAKLSFRQFMGEKARLLSAVMAVVLLTPVIIGFAIATGAGYLFLPEQWPAQLLGFVLIVSWLIWIFAPLFSFNVNEGLDPTRLLVYPITRRDFLAHMLLGTLLDYPTYFLAPFGLAIIVGFGLGWTLPIVLIALFLAYLLMALTSQTLINILGGILKSRRFRDIMMVAGAFIGFGCWGFSTAMQNVFGAFDSVENEELANFFQSWQPLDLIKWFPPGAAAKAIEQAAAGAWGWSLLWLAYTLLWVVIVGWLWWRVTHRIVTGEGFLIGGAPTAEKEKPGKNAAKAKGVRRGILDWIPADIRAIALKEVRIRWRTPQSRIGLIYMFLLPVFMVFSIFFFGDDTSGGSSDVPANFSKMIFAGGIAAYTTFTFWTNGQNMFGWETTGLSILFLTPISRQRLFFGKVLAQFLMNGIPILVICIAAIVFQPGLLALSLLPTSVALGLASLSIVSIASALFPYVVNMDKQSGQNPFAGKGGCITGIANSTIVPSGIALVCLPVAAPLAAALLLDWEWLALVGSVFTLAYSAVLFYFATRFAGRLALRREPEIILAASPKDK